MFDKDVLAFAGILLLAGILTQTIAGWTGLAAVFVICGLVYAWLAHQVAIAPVIPPTTLVYNPSTGRWEPVHPDYYTTELDNRDISTQEIART